MSNEVKQCTHVACKCTADDDECCSPFCKDVETSENGDKRCGCGHMACDTTSQFGNENSFDSRS